MPPSLHSLLAPPIIYIVRTTLGFNHMGHQRLNIVRRTMFHANNVRLPAHEGASLG